MILNKVKKHYLIVMIIFLAIIIRLYNWDKKFAFNAEYNYKLWPIQQMINNKKIPLIGIEAVSYLHHLHYPPFFLYIFAPILYWSKYSPASIEISLIFLSGLTTYVYFLLGKKIKDNLLGYIMALVYAVSFFIQRADKFIWVVGLVYIITASFLYVLLRCLNTSKVSFVYSLILGGLIGLGLNFHYQVMLLPIALVLLMFLSSFRKKISIKTIIGFMLGIFIFILPLIIFDLRHNFYNSQGIIILILDSVQKGTFSQKLFEALNIYGNTIIGLLIPNAYVTYIFQISLFSMIGLFILVINIISMLHLYQLRKDVSLMIRYCGLIFISGILFYALNNKSFSYYLFIIQAMEIIFVANFIYLGLVKHNARTFTLLLLYSFILVNSYQAMTFSEPITYSQQISLIDHLFKSNRKNKLTIYFPYFPSEEYAFLLYHRAFVFGFDYKHIEIYEPWQPNNHADNIFTGKYIKYNQNKVNRKII